MIDFSAGLAVEQANKERAAIVLSLEKITTRLDFIEQKLDGVLTKLIEQKFNELAKPPQKKKE